MSYRLFGVSIAFAICLAVSTRAQAPHSTQRATELDSLLTARNLDAIAAADPQQPDRCVAALSYPKPELLVVDAVYPASALLPQEIGDAKYRDAYLALQQSGAPEGRRFFLDVGCDGLHGSSDAVDVLYEGATKRILFDGQPEKHKLTKKAHETEFAAAEAAYSRLLTVLINQLKQTGTP